MPGYAQKPPSGYLECEYASDWPGLVTNLPSSRIPPGACVSCNAMAVRGRLTPQPVMFPLTGTGGQTVYPISLVPGENICGEAKLQPPDSQQTFTVVITNLSVYISYIYPGTSGKLFRKIYTFPTAYPRYARFGTCVISDVLYFSSATQLGVYALRPTFQVQSVQVTNPGGYFTSAPAVVFSDGAGTSAVATATESGGNITAVTLTGAGSGYISPPVVSFSGGATNGPGQGELSASATAILSSTPSAYIVQEISALTGVAYISVTSPGHNYINPQVLFIGGGGTGAAGNVSVSFTTDFSGVGTIVGISVASPGQNYTSAPTIQIIDSGGPGTGATATAVLFQGLPFIGGDFMTSMSNRLILGNIVGGDGNNTVPVGNVVLTNKGAGYNLSASTLQNVAVVTFVGGGGAGASAYVPGSATTPTPIQSIAMGQAEIITGQATTGSHIVTNVSSTQGVVIGQTFLNTDFAAGTTVMAIGAGTITVSNPAGATAMLTAYLYGYVPGNSGSGYYATPGVNIFYDGSVASTPFTTPAPGGGATAIAQLSPIPQAASTRTVYPDRVAWSAPNAFGYFDPNYLIAAGGYEVLSEARGLVASVNVVESVGFIGHNGGITEMTPNTSSAQVPFAFYPLWSADEGVLVRYGSMAQYGSMLAFLANDSAYTMTPGGLTEIGINIANILQNCSTWNNGNFPLQGLYGSIVLIEGQKHYLIGLSADDIYYYSANAARSTTVFDFNIAEGSWHEWLYPGVTLTAPIYQNFDSSVYEPSTSPAGNYQLAEDSWILFPATVSSGSTAPYTDQASLYELCAYTQAVQLLGLSVAPVISPAFAYQFRTESPSIARMQSERRILIEYENEAALATLSIVPTVTLVYTGQQDPTTQTGTVSQQTTETSQVLNQVATPTITGQVLAAQADFGTFTGVCTTLGLSASGNAAMFSLVRLTQVADLPKAQVP